MNVQVFPGLERNVAPDLRNGIATDLLPPARRGAVLPQYYWRFVGGLDGRLSHGTIYVSVAYGALVAGTLDPAAAAPIAGDLAHFGNFGLTPATSAEIRKRAIILGAVRAGIAASYVLVYADLHATEAFPGEFVTVGVNGFTFGSAHTDAAANLTFEEAAVLSFPPLTDVELECYFELTKLGMGLVPLVGCSLLETGHHYLGDKAASFRGLEKQVLSGAREEVKLFFSEGLDENRGLAFHKACHPVGNALLTTLARSTTIAARLVAAGLGSVAIRVPHIESEVKAARAYVAIVESAFGWCQTSGYRLSVPRLTGTLLWVGQITHAGNSVAGRYGLPAGVSRADGIRNYLVPAMVAAEPAAAIASGVYQAIVEVTGGNTTGDTRLGAYSVAKLRKSRVAEVGQGMSAVRAFRLFQTNQIEKGNLALWEVSDDPDALAGPVI